ncbi:MAG: tRNA-uridine aminocarboxypropyltransferase [Bacteriovoracaceae bacterium]
MNIVDRKRKTKFPCSGCALHINRCICEFIPQLNLRTRVSLIVHAKELKRTTNTGTLAIKSLVNSELKVRGLEKTPLDLSTILGVDYRPLLFYPSDDALELTSELIQESPLPIQLIVPDGNWRQASKVHYRHPELKDVKRVMISKPNLETHQLRAEHTEHGMATLQAIALALGIIEGELIEEKLMNLYQKKLEMTLLGRAGG